MQTKQTYHNFDGHNIFTAPFDLQYIYIYIYGGEYLVGVSWLEERHKNVVKIMKSINNFEMWEIIVLLELTDFDLLINFVLKDMNSSYICSLYI
jgi:hypothetical protein